MALADYFPRDALAISQVLQGFETDAFTERLEGVRVAIAFDEEAATSRDGRSLLELTVRLAARLYPSLTFLTVPVVDNFAEELMALAISINPNIETTRSGVAHAALSIGADAPPVDAPTVYAGCDGWVGMVGTQGSYGTSDQGNPFGAGLAACIAAANLFRFPLPPRRQGFPGRRRQFSSRCGLLPIADGFRTGRPPGVGRRWSSRQ